MKNIMNFIRDIKLSREFNLTKVNGCSVESILTGKNNIPVAIKCNCGENIYHPIINGKSACWNHEASIVEADPSLVEEKITKKLMQLWIEEE